MRRPTYLRDTHVVVWDAQCAGSHPGKAASCIERQCNFVLQRRLGLGSIHNARMRATGKMKLRAPLTDAARRLQLTELAVSAQHGEAASMLPRHHGDPFDRLFIAQARIGGLILVTNDTFLSWYEVEVLFV